METKKFLSKENLIFLWGKLKSWVESKFSSFENKHFANSNVKVNVTVPANAVFTDTNTQYSAGTGLSLNGTQFNATSYVPAGCILAFMGNSVPSGWLLCNGQAVSRSTYSTLYSAIRTKYGGGNGSTTFNVPNLTNKFLQGSGTAGQPIAAGLPNITGSMSYLVRSQGSSAVTTSGAFTWSEATVDSDGGEERAGGKLFFDASKSNSIYGASTTVQPPAVTCLYIIKC